MLAAMMKKLGRQQAAVADSFNVLDQLRESVAEAKATLSRIEAAPVPAAEATEALAAWLDKTATAGIDRLNLIHLLAPGRAASGLRLPFPTSRVEGGVVVDAAPAVEVLFAMLLAVNRQAVLDLLSGQINDLADGQEAIPAAERQARIEAARAAILEAEMAEEACCRALERAGVQVQRRGDADPRAVLADDASLPV